MKIKEITGKIAEALISDLVYLHDRWQDEREYENFTDYVKHAETKLAEKSANITTRKVTFLKLKKRPFSIEYQIDSQVWMVAVTNTKAYGRRIS